MKRPGIVRECEHPGKPHKHGLACYQRDKCRCELGRAAVAQAKRDERRQKYLRTYSKGRVSPVGARRRIQALITLGYTTEQIGQAGGGFSRRTISDALHVSSYLNPATADGIAKAYDQLWDKPTPNFGSGRYMRGIAAKRGYLPPMAWDDDSIDDPAAKPFAEVEVDIDWQVVERAVAGKPRGRRLTKRERQAAAQAMAAKGATATQIAKRLGMSGTEAKRYAQEVAA